MIIITGHGNFGSGFKSSLDLIAGKYDFIKTVDFIENKSSDDLKEEINNMIKDTDNKVYIFTDLPGGTPFKVSSELALEHSNIEVFCGTNLPMLVESTMMVSLGFEIDSEAIKTAGINSIKPPIRKVVLAEDGI